MKGNPKVIAALNDVLTGELTAINQYFLHSRMCRDWGYARLADKIWEESKEEMIHAQKIVDRVLFLEGLPNLQKLNKLHIGENVHEVFKSDLKLEFENIPFVKQAINECFPCDDNVSRELLERIHIEEEEHVDWLEAQLGMIETIGIENYLAEQMRS